MKEAVDILKEVKNKRKWDENSLQKILRKYPKDGKGLYRHDELVAAYKELIEKGEITKSKVMEQRIRLKPTRTQSGVAIVTVLMKPYPCPGKCIFCPNQSNMPKSYIASNLELKEPYHIILTHMTKLNTELKL